MHDPSSPARELLSTRFRRALPARLLLFGFGWIVLTEGDLRYWLLSGIIVFAAAAASVHLEPQKPNLRIRGSMAFIRYFLEYSFRGGVDVAMRAIRPRPDLDPGVIEFHLTLPRGGARTFFSVVIGLLPGTLSTGIDGDRLRVHLLDRKILMEPQLRALELRVADAFGIRL